MGSDEEVVVGVAMSVVIDSMVNSEVSFSCKSEMKVNLEAKKISFVRYISVISKTLHYSATFDPEIFFF